MTAPPAPAAALDRGIDFDAARLDAYLRALPNVDSGVLDVRRTEGGMSNPTYYLRRGEWQAVLRKQPAGKVLPSAHAIDREFRVLSALQGSEVPVPKPLHYCSDREVLGTPFYLMQRLQGRVMQVYSTPGLAHQERAAVFDAMVATLAAIHRLDVSPTTAGPATTSHASSNASATNGRSSGVATTTTPRSTASSRGSASACPKAS
jgi:aminoglycoside phosphotransferase (APT) family kinase protein